MLVTSHTRLTTARLTCRPFPLEACRLQCPRLPLGVVPQLLMICSCFSARSARSSSSSINCCRRTLALASRAAVSCRNWSICATSLKTEQKKKEERKNKWIWCLQQVLCDTLWLELYCTSARGLTEKYVYLSVDGENVRVKVMLNWTDRMFYKHTVAAVKPFTLQGLLETNTQTQRSERAGERDRERDRERERAGTMTEHDWGLKVRSLILRKVKQTRTLVCLWSKPLIWLVKVQMWIDLD